MTENFNAFEPLQTKRVPAQIAEMIIGAIVRGEYPKGSRLPPERHLASTLGVSRSSLRQAISTLELAGIVSAQHGSGTLVIADAEQLNSWEQQILPPQILEVRLLIEPELAALAAQKRTPETVKSLEQALKYLESQYGEGQIEYNDHSFHIAVGEAAQNPILLNTLKEALRYTANPTWKSLKQEALKSHDSIEGHLNEARALVRAIAAGKAKEAFEIWRDHLRVYRKEMLSGQHRR